MKETLKTGDTVTWMGRMVKERCKGEGSTADKQHPTVDQRHQFNHWTIKLLICIQIYNLFYGKR